LSDKKIDKITYRPIGIIRSPFKNPQGSPIQFNSAGNFKGSVIIFPQYVEGLRDLEYFSHAILLYHFHLIEKPKLTVKPFMDEEYHGIFATRAPARPNPLGISIVRIISIENNVINIANVDILDQTPLLDIKPYVPGFDIIRADKIGWLASNMQKLDYSKDDGRFVK